MISSDGRQRVVIEGIVPQVDHGQFAIKRIQGEAVHVTADIFADGHDLVNTLLLYRHESQDHWTELPLQPTYNDLWLGTFHVTELGQYFYTFEGWVDSFQTWRRDLEKRQAAQQDVHVDLQIGAQLIHAAAKRAASKPGDENQADAELLEQFASNLPSEEIPLHDRSLLALDDALNQRMQKHTDRSMATRYPVEFPVTVERERARFSAWYELFPRSCSSDATVHGTLADVEARLPYVAGMGFNVLYLPPIHPIGQQFRKGKNNSTTAAEGDVGSPWAIGSSEGGHKAIHPELGTLRDFQKLVRSAQRLDIDLAMDIAFQCSPDHPYVTEHPSWFRARPDGTVQYAENPPKKYQDIYPFDFETEDWQAMWEELKSIFLYWIEQGVTIFRVDNPHTKAFPFWQWCIAEIKKLHPETIFLSEAFTRPKVMFRLAKLGFSQSYTYFTWRNTKAELTEYLTELTQAPACDIFRPNFWPNTPDILPVALHSGERAVFEARVILAATLSANFGLYGPAYEFCVSAPREPGSEEYLDSEKYEIRPWSPREDSLSRLLTQLNQIRNGNWALQSNQNLVFHPTDNDQMLCYSKHSDDGQNIVLVVVNLDPHTIHSAWIELDLERFGIQAEQEYQLHDLLTDSRYVWQGPRNFVQLDPAKLPAHIFRLRRKSGSQASFT